MVPFLSIFSQYITMSLGRQMICGASISRPHRFYMAKVTYMYYGIGILKTMLLLGDGVPI
jgi:hypothetical protein